ncbi:MAG: sigma-70 family RNA polymerase sigma factor [Mameliella sp.]|nr:sigma-70 family RNA polymerase sigma factor [Mameliella sp.]
MTTRSDIEALIARVALRDRSAFGALYDATSGKLLAICLSVLKDREEAEDTLQEVFLRIWNKADRYAVTGHSPMTWLITLARNIAIDRLRARQRSQSGQDRTETDTLPDSRPGPEASTIAASESQRIVNCLDELPDQRASAVRGAYLEGASYADLAAKFEVPLNTMRTWLRRSLQSLRECMSR